MMDTKINLCDTCKHEIQTCDACPAHVKYGDGIGGDNVIKCEFWEDWNKEPLELENERLTKQLQILRDIMKDFVDYGVRHDMAPTRIIKKEHREIEIGADKFYQAYLKSIDDYVKGRAIGALILTGGLETNE